MSDPMGDGLGDELFGDVRAPSVLETHMLPAMHAVPATALGVLPRWTRVTVGVPGSHWVIEQNVIVDGPYPDPAGGDEQYELVAMPEWGATRIRPDTQQDVPAGCARVMTWRAPVTALWVYRFATRRRRVQDLPAWDPNGWFANIRTTLDTPPSPRHPRPARELPSLSGRRLHAATADGIQVLIAVSEPLDVDGDIVVRLLSLPDYGKACYGATDVDVRVLPLHQLWAY